MHVGQGKAMPWIALVLQIAAHVSQFLHKRSHTYLLNWPSAGLSMTETVLGIAIQSHINRAVDSLVVFISIFQVIYIVFAKVGENSP